MRARLQARQAADVDPDWRDVLGGLALALFVLAVLFI